MLKDMDESLQDILSALDRAKSSIASKVKRRWLYGLSIDGNTYLLEVIREWQGTTYDIFYQLIDGSFEALGGSHMGTDGTEYETLHQMWLKEMGSE